MSFVCETLHSRVGTIPGTTHCKMTQGRRHPVDQRGSRHSRPRSRSNSPDRKADILAALEAILPA
jgi:hypothetical protein